MVSTVGHLVTLDYTRFISVVKALFIKIIPNAKSHCIQQIFCLVEQDDDFISIDSVHMCRPCRKCCIYASLEMLSRLVGHRSVICSSLDGVGDKC